jgi:surface polysaccharide O-acyltransferase-like enzyme
MLSGALLVNKRDSLKTFFKKRLSRIFIPFIFWAIIYIIYSSAYIKHTFDFSSAIDIFFGTSGTLGVAFWFIWMIVIIYIGIFLINKIIEFGCKKRENFSNEFIAVLTLLALAYISCSDFGLFSPYTPKLLYFASFLSYIIIGYFIANNELIGNKINSKIIIIVTLLGSCCLYSYYIFGFVVPQSISANHFVYRGYFNLLLLALAVDIFVLFKYLSKTKYLRGLEESYFGNAIINLSKYSFGLYLCHYLILYILRLNLFGFYRGWNPLVSILMLVILTVSISLLVLWVLSKIPYLDKFTGKS